MKNNWINTLINNNLAVVLLSLFGWVSNASLAQTVEVNPANGSIKEKSLKGFVVCLELDVKDLEKSWSRYLKSLGKFETVERQAMVGSAIMLPAVSSDALDFYSKITVSPRCVQVFMGGLRAGSSLELLDIQNENIKKLLYDFAVEQYRQDLIGQISEAERVVNLAVKAHDKRESEGENLKSKMKRNRKEKVNLLKSIEENASDLKKLQTDSTRNVTEKESALEEISKVRKIAEDKKQKLSQIK